MFIIESVLEPLFCCCPEEDLPVQILVVPGWRRSDSPYSMYFTFSIYLRLVARGSWIAVAVVITGMIAHLRPIRLGIIARGISLCFKDNLNYPLGIIKSQRLKMSVLIFCSVA